MCTVLRGLGHVVTGHLGGFSSLWEWFSFLHLGSGGDIFMGGFGHSGNDFSFHHWGSGLIFVVCIKMYMCSSYKVLHVMFRCAIFGEGV